MIGSTNTVVSTDLYCITDRKYYDEQSLLEDSLACDIWLFLIKNVK